MATPNYDALVTKVRSWANRDSNVLTDALLADFLDYSADYCYRKLRIPPLEYTYQYPVITSQTAGETTIQMPPDLSEVISFTKIDSAGNVQTFDRKLSLRAFSDEGTVKPHNSFAYKGGNIQFYPKAAEGDIYELHYYRRLFDLDATYVVNQQNVDLGNCLDTSPSTEGAIEFPTGSGIYYIGNEVYNWLRDDNERVLLWGAFAHALDFLGEDERAMKFFQKQEIAIDELNREEKLRKARGAENIITYATSELM